jgi:PEP-CTERM motif-containing protein
MKILLALMLALLPIAALAGPTLSFDTVPGGAGGFITYDGVGGPAIGSAIKFVDLVGQETPLHNGVVLDCVDCLLSFATGPNTLEGPPQYTWAGGGTFSLVGDVPALGLDDATLVSGRFTGTPNTPGLAAAGSNALFLAVGVDTKDPVLAAYYGLTPADFVFANTEIALGTFAVNPQTGAFRAFPNQADLINAPVPEPSTWLLVGAGVVGLALLRHRCWLG